MDSIPFDYAPVALAIVQVVLGIVVLILAKFALAMLSPYSTDQEMTAKDNPAFGLAISGYYAGTVLIYLGAAVSAGPLPLDSGARAVFVALGQDVAWTVAGIAALNGSRWLMDRLLVTGVRNDVEIIEHRNVAAGAVECGGYFASAIVLAAAIRQPGGTPWTALAVFLLGQCALILLGHLYQRFIGYDVSHEVRSANLAAAIALGMTLIALSLIMVKAIGSEFAGWVRHLSFFAIDAMIGLVLLMVLRRVTDLALLPHARVREEIVRDRNVNAGLVQGVLAVGIAALILFLF